MTKYIYFDLGNVLLSFSHAKACRQVARLAQVNEEVVQELIFDEGLLTKLESGQLDERQFHKMFCESTGTHCEIADFFTAYSDIFDVIQPMEKLIANLSADVPLGILSNTSSAHWAHVCNGSYALLPGGFRDFVLSFEVGSMKPNRRIYEKAIELAGCDPVDIFFCDDREENVAGAKEIGIDAIQFHSAEQIKRELDRRMKR